MLFPFGSSLWLVLKDGFIALAYLYFILYYCIRQKSILLGREVVPVVAYFIFTLYVYCYAVIAHHNHIGLFLVGIRVDLFYVPLFLIALCAFQEEKIFDRLNKMFLIFLVLNTSAAVFQFLFPDTAKIIPGLGGLGEEGVNINKTASFTLSGVNNMMDYVTGLFGGVGKFSRNMFHIMFWFTLFFVISSSRNTLRLALVILLVGVCLILGIKRLPILIFCYFLFALPVLLYFALRFTRRTADQDPVRQSVSRLKTTVSTTIISLCLLSAVGIATTEKGLVYAKFIQFALTSNLEDRFLKIHEDRGWVSEQSKIARSEKAFYGQGPGTSTMGFANVMNMKDYSNNGFFGVEHGPLKVWLEFGVLGIIQFTVLWAGLFFLDIKTLFAVRKHLNLVAASLMISNYHLITFISFLVGHHYWDDSQGQIHFWLITGLQVLLWRRRVTGLSVKIS